MTVYLRESCTGRIRWPLEWVYQFPNHCLEQVDNIKSLGSFTSVIYAKILKVILFFSPIFKLLLTLQIWEGLWELSTKLWYFAVWCKVHFIIPVKPITKPMHELIFCLHWVFTSQLVIISKGEKLIHYYILCEKNI